jgi:hypothetical protein
MKKIQQLMLSLALPCLSFAQPTITNAGDLTIGTVLKFKSCDGSTVTAGSAGANQVWNYANVTQLQDTVTEWMVHPSTTTNGNLFPSANLVEKYSDGKFVYLNKTTNENQMVGYVDTTQSFPPTDYPDPMLIIKRPITFGNVFTDNFVMTGSSTPGTITLNADAYGTLILPNGTFTNVLRVKMTIVHPFFSVENYIWYDGIKTSALLKLSEYDSFEYLLSEFVPTALKKEIMETVMEAFPNPADHVLNFSSEQEGTLMIFDQTGKAVRTIITQQGTSAVPVKDLPNGIYNAIFRAAEFHSKTRFIISH